MVHNCWGFLFDVCWKRQKNWRRYRKMVRYFANYSPLSHHRTHYPHNFIECEFECTVNGIIQHKFCILSIWIADKNSERIKGKIKYYRSEKISYRTKIQWSLDFLSGMGPAAWRQLTGNRYNTNLLVSLSFGIQKRRNFLFYEWSYMSEPWGLAKVTSDMVDKVA